MKRPPNNPGLSVGSETVAQSKEYFSDYHISSNFYSHNKAHRTFVDSCNAVLQRKLYRQSEYHESPTIAPGRGRLWLGFLADSVSTNRAVSRACTESHVDGHFASDNEQDMVAEDVLFRPKFQRPDRACQLRACRSSFSSSLENGEKASNRDPHILGQTGVNTKSCRSSVKIPDKFYIEICELKDEYVTTSKIPGKTGKEVGRGTTAIVKIMRRKGLPKTQYFAVKEFRRRGRHENRVEYERKVKTEFSIAASLSHPNIVKTLRLCHDTGRWSHVMEYCRFGDLYTLVRKNYLQEADKLCLFKQLLQGVAYLHENGIAHRDIKLENLLLSEMGHLKIIDFGLSEIFEGLYPILRSQNGNSRENMRTIRKCSPNICGSLPYIAPEVLAKKGDYDPRFVDVWSCAIVCFAMWHHGTPWTSATPEDANYSAFASSCDELLEFRSGVCANVKTKPCGIFFSGLRSSSLRQLLLQMLHPAPENRPSVRQVLNHRAMNSIDCCCPDPMETPAIERFDAAGRNSSFKAAKMTVRVIHNHIPPGRS